MLRQKIPIFSAPDIAASTWGGGLRTKRGTREEVAQGSGDNQPAWQKREQDNKKTTLSAELSHDRSSHSVGLPFPAREKGAGTNREGGGKLGSEIRAPSSGGRKACANLRCALKVRIISVGDASHKVTACLPTLHGLTHTPLLCRPRRSGYHPSCQKRTRYLSCGSVTSRKACIYLGLAQRQLFGRSHPNPSGIRYMIDSQEGESGMPISR